MPTAATAVVYPNRPTEVTLFPILGSPPRSLFLGVLVAAAVLYIASTDRIMEQHWPTAVVFALLISSVSTQLIAYVWESRLMWPPSTQFQSFAYGDLLCLPILTGCLAYLAGNSQNHSFTGWGTWAWVALGLALLIATGFRFMEASAYYDGAYKSATKLWHDWFVMVVFPFVLIKYAPALWYGGIKQGGTLNLTVTGVALMAFAVWAYLLVGVDGDSNRPKPTNAHFSQDWDTGGLTGSISKGVPVFK